MRVDGVRECCRGLHAVDATLPREDTSLRRRRHDRVPSQVFTLSVLELFHGWKIYDYLIYTRYRFLQRETRWKGLEDSLDECIDESVRTLDQMCFSSQYYMMMTVPTQRQLEIASTACEAIFMTTSVASRRARVASRRVPTQVQVNGIMMFIFGMQMMVQAQYNVFGDQMMPFIFGADAASFVELQAHINTQAWPSTTARSLIGSS